MHDMSIKRETDECLIFLIVSLFVYDKNILASLACMQKKLYISARVRVLLIKVDWRLEERERERERRALTLGIAIALLTVSPCHLARRYGIVFCRYSHHYVH